MNRKIIILITVILAAVSMSACSSLMNNGRPAENGTAAEPGKLPSLQAETAARPGPDVETIVPGILTVGYTDIYVDGYLNQDESGPHGLDSELAGMIADALGLEIQWLLVPNEDNFFESIKKSLNGKKIDMFISVTNIQAERKKEVLFSVPYTTEGNDIGISFRLDNRQLKEAIDPVIQKLVASGAVAKLKTEYVDPLQNIFETNNTMKLLSGIYFVQSRSVGGIETGTEGLDHIEIVYYKQWYGYDVRGKLMRNIKIDTAGYGKLRGTLVESLLSGEQPDAAVTISFNPEELKTTGVAEMQLETDGKPAETLIMIKVE